MAHQFAAIAFTDDVRKVQEEMGSRAGYASFDRGDDFNAVLTPAEAEFIAARDSFYMASVNESGWPYVQHRGGPAGFLKVVDGKTLAFADFSGNRQYVSTGNFRSNDRVSLILMDYPNRRRLKILGRVRCVPNDPEFLLSLEDPAYGARVERVFAIDIQGFDWNCPQHITPRFTEADIEQSVAPLLQQLEQLKAQQTVYPAALGQGDLKLVIAGIRQLTPNIRAYELRSFEGSDLPLIEPGAHVEIPIQLEDGSYTQRRYSICSHPHHRDVYEIAVQSKPHGVGSTAIHRNFQIGQILNCTTPENYFDIPDKNQPALLIAGGIGITPIKSIAHYLKATCVPFQLHYAGRNLNEMAYQAELKRELDEHLQTYTSNSNRMDIEDLLSKKPVDTHVYVCGPNAMIDDTLQTAERLNINPQYIHVERFNAPTTEGELAFEVELSSSNKTISVGQSETLLEALHKAEIDLPYSCLNGECKTCVVQVKEGEVKHNDQCLSAAEKADGMMCPCVSRAAEKKLVLDL